MLFCARLGAMLRGEGLLSATPAPRPRPSRRGFAAARRRAWSRRSARGGAASAGVGERDEGSHYDRAACLAGNLGGAVCGRWIVSGHSSQESSLGSATGAHGGGLRKRRQRVAQASMPLMQPRACTPQPKFRQATADVQMERARFHDDPEQPPVVEARVLDISLRGGKKEKTV